MAPIVTSDGYSWERKELHLSLVIFVLGAMLSFSASFNLKNLALCVSSLRRVHAKKLQTLTTLLELCVSARAGTMNSVEKKKKLHFSGSCLVQRPRRFSQHLHRRSLTTQLRSCVIFALLDVLSSVPAFRPSRTQWAVYLAEDAALTHQEHSKALHS